MRATISDLTKVMLSTAAVKLKKEEWSNRARSKMTYLELKMEFFEMFWDCSAQNAALEYFRTHTGEPNTPITTVR